MTEDAAPRGLQRAFVAVVPSRAALDAVDAALVDARSAAPTSLRWTPRAQWHVTLQYLGLVADAGAVVDALLRAVGDVAPFPLCLGGGGAFPKGRAATVLWAGVHDDADELHALAAVVTRATATLGFAPEDRPYRPHLTLARSARPTDLRDAVSALDVADGGPGWTVEEIVVFESDTGPGGVMHRIVARCPLATGERP